MTDSADKTGENIEEINETILQYSSRIGFDPAKLQLSE